MSQELFEQLEQRVNGAVDTIEMQRMELDELRRENERLKQERQQWETRLEALLGRFRELDRTDTEQRRPEPDADAQPGAGSAPHSPSL